MAQAGYTPISLYYSTTASTAPSAGNLVSGELAINITDGKLFYKDNAGVVQTIATKAGANGDVVGPASSTDNAIVRFDLTTGKIIQNSSALVDDSGNVLAGAGLVGAPAFSTTGDTNTGIFFPAADTIAFAEGGVEAMRIDSSGNVGINSTSPSTFGKLTIQVAGTTTPTNATNVGPSSINFYPATNGSSTDCTTGIFSWNSNTPGVGSGIGFSRENSSDWGTQIRFYTHPTALTNNGDITERFRIASSGAIGLSGANYGTSGQVLTSNGSGSAPTWQTSSGISTGKSIAMAMIFGF
jgi:hypothetical protein